MKKIFISAAIFLLACGGGGSGDSDSAEPSSNACGDIGLSPKIINGTQCNISNNTPILRIIFLEKNGDVGTCTGTVLSNKLVLTAAHCLSSSPVSVLVLSGPTVESAERFPVTSYTIHPDFNEDGFPIVNDVAILRLRDTINVTPMPILVNQSVEEDDILSIFGYGRTESGSDLEELRSGEMKVAEVKDNTIRADYDGVGSNTCFGDSGGPLISTVTGNATLVGVTSFGTRKDCKPGDDSYFANLQSASILEFLANFDGIQYK